MQTHRTDIYVSVSCCKRVYMQKLIISFSLHTQSLTLSLTHISTHMYVCVYVCIVYVNVFKYCIVYFFDESLR